MIVAVTGATGFVGQRVAQRLCSAGHQVRAVSLRTALPPDALAGCHAVIHLAGEPVAQRWTAEVRRRIRESRVEGTRRLVAAMRPVPPQVLVSASAVGYYGTHGNDDVLTEASPPSNDFLGEASVAWEREAQQAEQLGVRVVRLRLGLVLGPGGGLQKMLLPFRLGMGGPIAGGGHWMSWIHRDDLVSLILFMLKESTVRGVFNATSPHPVTNAEFTRALAGALHRPAFIPIPALALKILFGQMADTVLASQRVLPEATLRTGFTFEYPDVFAALKQILSR
jgi:uncharacterized protein (TIGR01777 family)